MAVDQIEVMQALDFDRFHLVGHDRGARVAHRLALDHPDRVTKLALLDILPTTAVMEGLTRELAMSVYHWFFLTQPYDLPERLVGADPSFYLRWHLGSWSGDDTLSFVTDEAMVAYERALLGTRARFIRRPRTSARSCQSTTRPSAQIAASDSSRVRSLSLGGSWQDRGRHRDLA